MRVSNRIVAPSDVQADHRLLGAEEGGGERLAELRLAHAGRPGEHKARDGPVGIPRRRLDGVPSLMGT